MQCEEMVGKRPPNKWVQPLRLSSHIVRSAHRHRKQARLDPFQTSAASVFVFPHHIIRI